MTDSDDATATAHEHWQAEWAAEDGTSEWTVPEPRVARLMARLAPGSRVLDLGAGVGRHALLFARAGHRVTAVDAAPAGLAALARAATAEGLDIATHQGPMTALPFPDAAFDHVVAWNVIYHGDEGIVRRTLAEIARVLRPGGLYQGTMLSHRRLALERAKAPGREVSPGTWVFDVAEGDKRHPHFFCDAGALLGLMAAFDLRALEDEGLETPGKGHWFVVAERR